MSRTVAPPRASMDWSALVGFSEREVNGHVQVTYKDGAWGKPEWKTEPYLTMHVAATCLNYGQQVFEGIKAYRTASGNVHIFRPHDNAARLALSARLASLPEVPEPLFLDCLKATVAGNLDLVPPYAPNASAGALYLRPLLLATGPSLLLEPPEEFTFVVWCSPVGSLYGTGKAIPAVDAFVLDSFDRTAPMGTGHAKLGGNYAPVLLPSREAKKRGYPITLHLDSATRTWIDEFSTSNALAIEEGSGANASEAESKDSECVSNGGNSRITLVVPESTSILRSVTKVTVCEIAEKICGWNVELRQVAFEELKGGKFTEVLAAGTAAGITPIRSVSYNTHGPVLVSGGSTLEPTGPRFEHPPENSVKRIALGDGQTAGPRAQRLFEELTAHQCGDREDRFGWLWPKEGIALEDALPGSALPNGK